MRRWDIILTPFPFTDLSGQKVRPALVLFVDEIHNDMIVAFLTSNPFQKGVFDVFVPKSKENGLRIDSILRLSKLATLDTKCAIGKLGTIQESHRKTIHTNLQHIFGFAEESV